MAITLKGQSETIPYPSMQTAANNYKNVGRPMEGKRTGKWWYVPGDFDQVIDENGTAHTNIKNLFRFSGLVADSFALDASWRPNPNGKVEDVAVSVDGTLLFVVGGFSTIGGLNRDGIAAIRLSDGAVHPDYFSGFSQTGGLTSCEIDDAGNLWVGGNFTAIGGVSRNHLAMLDVSDSSVTVMTSMATTTSGDVYDLDWDDTHKNMIVTLRDDGIIGASGTATSKTAAVSKAGVVAWRRNPNPGTWTFQGQTNGAIVAVATNGSNKTYVYDAGTGTENYWYGSDGNNQGCNIYKGYIFVGHHGDWVREAKNLQGAKNVGVTSHGLYVISAGGALQTWMPQFSGYPGTQSEGLKVFSVGKHEASGQVLLSGDWKTIQVSGGTSSRTQPRLALFIEVGSDGSDGSNPVTDTEPPSEPGGLTLDSKTATTVNFHWTPSTDNTGVDHYIVSRAQGSGAYAVVADPVTTASFPDTGLTANTLYHYKVRAVDAAGNRSTFSATPLDVTTNTTNTGDTTNPTTPTGLTTSGTVTYNSVALSWTASTDASGIDHYNIYRDGVKIGSTGTVTTEITHDLQLQYLFDSGHLSSTTVTDASGQANNGTLHNFAATPATATGHAGITGPALVFASASSQYIEAPDSASLDTADRWTIMAWVYSGWGSPVNDRWTVVSKGHCWELQVRTGTGSDTTNALKPRVGCFFEGDLVANWVTVTGPDALSANTFHHLAARYNGSFVSLWVNGVKVAQVAETRTPNTNAEAFHVGMHQQTGNNAEGPNSYFNGRIQLPKVYNVALTDAEILSLAQVGSGTGTVYADATVAGSTTYSYRVSAVDASTNANEGSLSTALSVTTPTAPVVTGDRYKWESRQPWHGGHFTSLEVDPVTAGVLYLTGDVGGVRRSTDYGDTFEWFQIGLLETNRKGASVVAGISPKGATKARVVVAFGQNSSDGTATIDTPVAVWGHLGAAVTFNSQNADPTLPAKPRSVKTLIAIDPSNNGVNTEGYIYAGQFSTGLVRSTDGGSNYSVIGLNGQAIRHVTLNPGTPQQVFVGTKRLTAGGDGPNPAGPAPPTDTTAPTAPGTPTFSATANTTTTVTWTASQDAVGVHHYIVSRATGAGAYSDIANVSTNSLNDSGLTAGTLYNYKVRAYDAANNVSASSAAGSVTTTSVTPGDTTIPTTPTALTLDTTEVVSASQANVTFHWTASTDNVGVDHYNVRRDGTKIGEATGTTYTDATAVPGATYSYTLRAQDAAGNLSGTSAALSVPVPGYVAPDTSPPTAPGTPTFAGTTSAATTVSWTAATDNVGVHHYEVARATGAGAYSVVGANIVPGDSFPDTGLAASTLYNYKVRAYDAANNQGPYSTSASVTTSAAAGDTTIPSTPQNLRLVGSASASQVSLAWDASTDNVGVDHYVVRRAGTRIGDSTTLDYTDQTVAPSTTYSYTVRAADAAGNLSGISTALSVTTPATSGGTTAFATNRTKMGTFVGGDPVGIYSRGGTASTAGTRLSWLEEIYAYKYEVIRVYRNWDEGSWNATFEKTAVQGGRALWMSEKARTVAGDAVSYADIADGNYDAHIQLRADEIKAMNAVAPIPFILYTFQHEPEGEQSGIDFSVTTYGNQAAAYKAAFAHYRSVLLARLGSSTTTLTGSAYTGEVKFGPVFFAVSYSDGTAGASLGATDGNYLPANAACDFYGADFYNWSPAPEHGGHPDNFWDEFSAGTRLASVATLAKRKGKRACVGETNCFEREPSTFQEMPVEPGNTNRWDSTTTQPRPNNVGDTPTGSSNRATWGQGPPYNRFPPDPKLIVRDINGTSGVKSKAGWVDRARIWNASQKMSDGTTPVFAVICWYDTAAVYNRYTNTSAEAIAAIKAWHADPSILG